MNKKELKNKSKKLFEMKFFSNDTKDYMNLKDLKPYKFLRMLLRIV